MRLKPEAEAFGRLKKPHEALDARECKWVSEELMKRANPSPYKTKARLGLSAMALSVIRNSAPRESESWPTDSGVKSGTAWLCLGLGVDRCLPKVGFRVTKTKTIKYLLQDLPKYMKIQKVPYGPKPEKYNESDFFIIITIM